MSPSLFAAIGALLGLLLGSFANVVIARVPEGKSVAYPPSACPTCGYQIKWFDNIPILSYLLLGGKCRQCQTHISRRYPLVEATMALLFAFYGYWVGASGDLWVLPGVWTFVFASLCLLVIDIDTFRLPNAITKPLAVACLVLFGGAALINGEYDRLWSMAFGPVFIAGILFLVNRIRPNGMGLGDVKYAIPMGLALGYFGYGTVIVGYFFALFIGVAWGMVLIGIHGKSRKAHMPFGPGLVLGAYLAIPLGQTAAQLYLNVTGL